VAVPEVGVLQPHPEAVIAGLLVAGVVQRDEGPQGARIDDAHARLDLAFLLPQAQHHVGLLRGVLVRQLDVRGDGGCQGRPASRSFAEMTSARGDPPPLSAGSILRMLASENSLLPSTTTRPTRISRTLMRTGPLPSSCSGTDTCTALYPAER